MTRSTAARLITAAILDYIHVRYSVGAAMYARGETSEWAKRDYEKKKELLKALQVLTQEKQKEMR